MLSDIALTVTAIGVLGVVYGLRQSYRERLRQFEAMYVQRYWSLLDRLSLDALSAQSLACISHDDQKVIRAYINLCEDELEMRRHGYIADATYILWADGIRGQLSQPMFGAVWKQVLEEEHAFRYKYLSELLQRGEGYDPSGIPLWWRQLRGLAGPRGI